LFACGIAACIPDTTGPELDPEADLTVLFIGNSLTTSNDLPALTRDVAAAAGRRISYAVRAERHFSLEDHWEAGVGELIAELGAEVVVLQQGPSSLPENQEHLRHWTTQLDGPIRAAGGRPALFMVWPEASRSDAFDDVHASYRGAAEAVDGIFIPAGEAWRAVWRRDPDAALTIFDGFHPSELGSLVAALTIYAALFNADVRTLPNSIAPDVPPQQFTLILEAVHEAIVAARGATP
jgi:hypothetical protein